MATDLDSGLLFDQRDHTTLEGSVLRVVYSNPHKGWAVIRLDIEDRREPITAVGYLVGVQPGEQLRLTGSWEQDRKYGRQFRVATFLGLMPNTVKGIERFLGSGLIPGIGKVMAERMVSEFGIRTLEIIEEQPGRLTEVKGIGAHRAQRIRQAWQRQKGVREILIFLQAHGISLGQALKIHRQYGPRALEVIRSNPYRLAEDIYGFGFQTADRIAAQLGIAPDAPARAAAGTLHVLANAAGQGHVYLPKEKLTNRACELLELPPESIQTAIGDLAGRQRVVEDTTPDTMQIDIYQPRLFAAECEIASRIRDFTKGRSHKPHASWSQDLTRFEREHEIAFSVQQKEAVRRSLEEELLIITGGPGTGKTTLIRAVVELQKYHDHRIALAAPTGRAAKRLAEATNLEAKTLHRLLEFEPRGMSFKRNRERPLEADLVIVDETSMLDFPLAWHLLEAIPRGCRLILVGDVDQLPSVGPGRFLADLIDSGTLPVVRLGEVFRQASKSLIVANAHRIRQGLLPRFETDPNVDFFFIERQEPKEILETIEHLVTVRIPRRFGLDPQDDIQILAPMRRGQIGVEQLNLELQNLLSAQQPELEVLGGRFRRGDRVMQTRNNYDLEVFNGDIGHAIVAGQDGETLVVNFYGRRVTYPIADTDQLVLAYACTIHKSQGSEYPCVIIPIHSQHHIMLQRNLIYTAVTRGRRLVIIVGEQRALAQAVRNDRQQVRYTRLTERLRAGLQVAG